MRLVRSLNPLLIAAFIAGTAGFCGARVASAQTSGPVYLHGNAMVQQDRLQLLRDEFKERQQELRELKERAELAKKHKLGRGKKAEPVIQDIDYVGMAA